MKKILVSLAIMAAAAISVNAQELSVSAGYLNSTQKSEFSNASSKVSANGFYAGAGAAKSFSDLFSLSSGVYFSYLTSKSDDSLWGFAGVETTVNEYYFSIPVHANLNFALGNTAKLFVFAGPMFNIGLASNSQGSAYVGSKSATSEKVDNYADDSNYGRFDLMASGGLGLQIACIKVFGGYNYGLLDRNKSDNAKLHRSEVMAGLAFCF